MGACCSCCSKDPDSKTSWSPAETNNASTTSTIVAQPTNENNSTGVFTSTIIMPVETDGEKNSETIIKTAKVTETVSTSND
ncbi:uncharacterized protein [Eurosta solidaginis]|uniref:uncharacterized protein n=1 Tax=Eurosta solidaginis TaxID=178769 RepID=UPI00353117A7